MQKYRFACIFQETTGIATSQLHVGQACGFWVALLCGTFGLEPTYWDRSKLTFESVVQLAQHLASAAGASRFCSLQRTLKNAEERDWICLRGKQLDECEVVSVNLKRVRVDSLHYRN